MRFLLSFLAVVALASPFAAATNCDLTSLKVSAGNLSPPFQTGNTLYTTDQTTGMLNGVATYYISGQVGATSTSLSLTLEDTMAGAALEINGKSVDGISGAWTTIQTGQTIVNIPLNPGVSNSLVVYVQCDVCRAWYTINIICPTTPGDIIGDPQFTGLRGQSFQVHGVPGEIYNIISSPALSYNARFVFLTAGKCPVIEGVKQKNCWSHPGTYLGEIGIRTAGGDRVHLIAGNAQQGFQSVNVNGKDITFNTKHQNSYLELTDGAYVQVNGTHTVTVHASTFTIQFENSDMFVNQRVKVTNWNAINAHGLLGQTWKKAKYGKAKNDYEGTVDDYLIQEKSIWGTNFLYNSFEQRAN